MTRKRHTLLALWMLAGMCFLAPGQASADEARPAAEAGFTLPFYTFNGHILIDGAVDGRRGKFMFDTGTEFPFFLNNHYLPLAKDSRIGEGHAASGQPMVLYRQRAPVAIEIGRDVRLDAVPGLIHTDWLFLEAAYTPAFLGSIGHGFNRDYVFVIDYDAQTIAFHPYGQDATALSRVIDPALVVATLPFTPTGVDGKMPEVDIRIGDETITARFDTGNLGTLELTEAMQTRLESQGRLHISASPYTYGAYEARRVASLNGLSHHGQALHDVRGLSFTSAPHNRVGLGYQFLRQYVTVWDYRARTLTLLAR